MKNWVVRFVPTIADVGPGIWNAIAGRDHPFTRYEFLLALEQSGATSERSGWQVSHAVVDVQGRAVAVMPLYLKSHSYGEYVFDFSWAQAWQRQGLSYYPKFVTAIPFTPVTGPRLFVIPEVDRAPVVDAILSAVAARAEALGISGWHVLFAQPELVDDLASEGLLTRSAVQFQWFNRGYSSYEDFLGQLCSRKRKALRRERSRVAEQGITLRTYSGKAITERLWDHFFEFYQLTYARLSGHGGYLNRRFFGLLGELMSEQLVLVMASRSERIIAGALNFYDADTLYGRYWGCTEPCDQLHFETCYHRGIDFCIANGLGRFDSGAQGEHKIKRGFEPVLTYSSHWIAEEQFRPAIDRFLQQEAVQLKDYRERASQLLPYKNRASV